MKYTCKLGSRNKKKKLCRLTQRPTKTRQPNKNTKTNCGPHYTRPFECEIPEPKTTLKPRYKCTFITTLIIPNKKTTPLSLLPNPNPNISPPHFFSYTP